MTQQNTAVSEMSSGRTRPLAWIVAAGLSVAVTVAVIFLAYGYMRDQSAAKAAADPRRMRAAVESAAVFLGSTELRGDDTWVVTQGAMRLGPTFRTWAETLEVAPVVESDLQHNPLASRTGGGIEGRLWALRWLSESEAPPLPPPNVSPAHEVSTALSEADIQALLRLMALTSVCSELAPTTRQEWLDALAADSHSYLLTHQLLAVMIGRNRGCLDEATALELRQRLATSLWVEHTADRSGVHDLSIERMAMLCYAQLCNWLLPEWLGELIEKQDASGSWGELNPGVHERVVARPEHTAALAFYVLASYWNERFEVEPPPVPPRPQ